MALGFKVPVNKNILIAITKLKKLNNQEGRSMYIRIQSRNWYYKSTRTMIKRKIREYAINSAKYYKNKNKST